ncbi:MAG: molybdate ABC transporter substrate-binding protein [Thiolinea sp.]
MQVIADLFQVHTGHQARLSFGSSGKFTAQIINGAPFEVFLSADAAKPARLLVTDGLAVAGTDFTYALGRLVLWSAQTDYVDAEGKILANGAYRHLAVADPKLAPYGRAAQQVLDALQLTEQLSTRFVQGVFPDLPVCRIEQVPSWALSPWRRIMQDGEINTGSAWVVPTELYEPIRQDAVLLKSGADNEAATALLAFMRSAMQERGILRLHPAASAGWSGRY